MLYHLILVLAAILVLSACEVMTPKLNEDTTTWSAHRFYTEAKGKMNVGSYDQAIELFEGLEARYPYGRYAQQAQLETAYAYYKDREPASAIAAAERFMKLHPNHPNVDYAYYIKGLANYHDNWGYSRFFMFGPLKQDMSERDSKASKASFDDFRELVRRFPESKYVLDAKQRMAHLLNLIAKSEVHVARYYMKRKAYVAAANRAMYAVREYPRTPATEEALYILSQAYNALGMTDLSDDAERILKQNFPDSELLGEIYEAENPSWWKFW